MSLEVDEATESSEPLDPVAHLGLLAYIRWNGHAHALMWIVDEGTALEGGGDHPVVHVSLAADAVDELVRARLVLRVTQQS